MKATAYDFRDSFRHQPGAVLAADLVGARLEKLRKAADGELTPAAVVEDAKNKASPLHSFFEWDDTAAANDYRLVQARVLIRAVVVVYEDEAEPQAAPVRVVAYSHIEGLGQPHYRDTADALAKPETRQIVLGRALKELQGWRRRYADLSELTKVFASADETADLFKRQG